MFHHDVENTYLRAHSGHIILQSGTTDTILVNSDGIVVTGVNTITGSLQVSSTVQADGDLSVDGETELDNINVTGVSTFIGTVNVTNVSLKMTATNAYLAPPSLTTTERNNATNLVAGAMIWNESANRIEIYNGSAWRYLNDSAV